MKKKISYYVGLILMIIYMLTILVHALYRINMDNISYEAAFNVGVALFGIVISLVIYNSAYLDSVSTLKNKYLFMLLVLVNATSLLLSGIFFMLDNIKAYRIINIVLNYLQLLNRLFLLLLFLKYIIVSSKFEGKIIKYIKIVNLAVFIASIVSVLLNPLYHHYFYINEEGVYSRGALYPFNYLFMIIVFISLIILLFKFKNINLRTKIAIILYIVIPIACALIQIFNFYITILNAGFLVSLVIIYCNISVQRSVELKINEAELEQQRLSSIIAQVEPHFMYNALNSIYYLTDKEPQKAKVAVNEFANYLRDGIESANKPLIISFEEELAHSKSYLSLEKLRFEDELNIEYDIKETNFLVPRFSLQPIIENAVKHGISQNKNGGKILIKTYKEGNYNIIVVKDDGVGFNTNILENSSRIGLKNVKYRLENLMDAKLEIQSEAGKGTTVTMYFNCEVK